MWKLRLNFPVPKKENHYSTQHGHEELFEDYVLLTFHTKVFYLVWFLWIIINLFSLLFLFYNISFSPSHQNTQCHQYPRNIKTLWFYPQLPVLSKVNICKIVIYCICNFWLSSHFLVELQGNFYTLHPACMYQKCKCLTNYKCNGCFSVFIYLNSSSHLI